MHHRGERETRPFGRRRPPEDRPLPAPARAPDPLSEAARPTAGPLRWALRTAALAGFAAVLVTQYLVRVSGPEGAVTQLALAPPHPHADPETTGSIARTAQAARLDPCTLAPARLRP